MKKNNQTYWIWISALMLLLISCGSDSKFPGYTRAKETGLHYKILVHNDNDTAIKPQEGDGVQFRYIITKYPNDSVIVDSKNTSQSGDGYVRFVLPKSTFRGSFEDGLKMMNEGDSALFIIPADSFFLKTMRYNELPKGIRTGMFLKGAFKLKSVVTKKELEENVAQQKREMESMMLKKAKEEEENLKAYLEKNKITQKQEESGLIVIINKEGKGPQPKAGDTVLVNYTGMLLDGKIFDTSIESVAKSNNIFQEGRLYKPFKFPLGMGYVIPGWEEGIAKLKKGSKARLIIPSSIGYGANGSPPVIPPFATLMFDVELVNIIPQKP
ncbi:MAG: FKBP-type peptidyl-prolyl cis-trans isomerase [Bacteroidia bacterium]|nr:FKBP-type peptidyl-prolyl cis-trans isomerase [Bacteroidia bacterium]